MEVILVSIGALLLLGYYSYRFGKRTGSIKGFHAGRRRRSRRR